MPSTRILTFISQQPQAMAGFGQETKYSAQQGFHQVKKTTKLLFFFLSSLLLGRCKQVTWSAHAKLVSVLKFHKKTSRPSINS